MNQTPNNAAVPGDLVELGRVAGAHGIKGWIKIQPFASVSDALANVKHWWLGDPHNPLAPSDMPTNPFQASVTWARAHGGFYLASLQGVSDRDAAEGLKGRRIFVSRATFPIPDEGEYYWVDLIGCRVTTIESGQSEPLGVVAAVLDNPAHPLLSVRLQVVGSDGRWQDRLDSKGKSLSTLVPFVSAHVLSVDLNARMIQTDWPQDF